MRTFLVCLLISSVNLFSQKLITPTNSPVDPKLIKDETSEAVWYAENAGQKIEIGSIITELKKLNKTDLLIRTTVKLKKAPDAKWTDSTIVKTANFQPVYHSSYNMMRDMVLKSGKTKVTGYYLDKKSQKKEAIEMEAADYFDSSSYPMMIRFSPLKENYTTEISIFDYNPNAKKGKIKAYILDVKKVDENGKKVWAVKTTDDIADKTSIVTYYIDPETRKILKQDIDMNGKKMTMETIQ
ncbi:DUF3108 domain-containing protein [Chryseobacterium vrystaatense]|uniref:Outer membrane lipoprotein-sorting protein n=1 Tax=Chryseobacterium vrystaatense TaxID=307480 RepID=A0A1M5KH90_9FLAO|nr:hypothetical protein [Chryseobacterium vrystaatense]KFF24105.1 hypothetical protein IW16_22305 [Chryseobacterium vrystaatense]SHG51849.1 hypothetical protein SAMN02787073_4363 [Chryseobacterium vrystaatense]